MKSNKVGEAIALAKRLLIGSVLMPGLTERITEQSLRAYEL
jgi:hypothetical protein